MLLTRWQDTQPRFRTSNEMAVVVEKELPQQGEGAENRRFIITDIITDTGYDCFHLLL